MKKKLMLCVIFIVILTTCVACSKNKSYINNSENNNIKKNKSELSLMKYATLQELEKTSDIIVEATVTDKSADKEYYGSLFTISDVNINKVIKGSNLGETLKISQMKADIPIIKPDEKLLIFLMRYTEDPNLYYITGTSLQGVFKIDTSTRQTKRASAKNSSSNIIKRYDNSLVDEPLLKEVQDKYSNID